MEKDLPLLEKATGFAFRAHKGQIRKGSGIPYVNHLCEVTSRVAHYMSEVTPTEIGVSKDEILTAAMLHDVIEDCEFISYDEVAKEFNKNIANIVLECSRAADKEEKIDKLRFLQSFKDKSLASVLIKIADRYCNVHDYDRTVEKKWYASTYALQAYPLYHAYFKKIAPENSMALVRSNHPLVAADISALRKVVYQVYNVDIMRTDFGKEIQDLVT